MICDEHFLLCKKYHIYFGLTAAVSQCMNHTYKKKAADLLFYPFKPAHANLCGIILAIYINL